MRKLPLRSVFKIVLEGRSSARFLVGTIFSFSFSMAVILCTLGLMDGFELTLKKALSFANGDIKVTSNNGHYIADEEMRKKFKSFSEIKHMTSLLQVESFALVNEQSKGILIKGIEPKGFQRITGLDVSMANEGVIVGSEFAKKFGLKVGSGFTLALASGKTQDQGSAILKDVTVGGIVQHGIFEKDMRFIYMDKPTLEYLLSYKPGVSNLTLLKLKTLSNLKTETDKLNDSGLAGFKFEPYWSEFEVLLDAVQVEKFSISLVLQLIVVVAILNIVAFIFYISEVKSQDLFMLRALGLSFSMLRTFWISMLVFIWLISVFVSLVLIELFAFIIESVPYLKIPGDVYVLSQLEIVLDLMDYFYVYGASLVWVLLIGIIMLRKMGNKSVLTALRQEFS